MRKQTLHRSYIADLVEQVRRLQPASSTTASSPTVSTATPQTASSTTDSQYHEHYFADTDGTYRYLGVNSCLVRSPRLQQAEVRTPVIPDDNGWELVWKGSSKTYDLVKTYLDVVQPLYPVLDPQSRILVPDLPADLVPTELFFLNMVCSISCYIQPARNRGAHPDYNWQPSGKLDFHHFASEKFRCLARDYFNQAMEYLEAPTVNPTMDTLRAVLLLVINTLFDPKSGNMGQQVALASRLALALEAKWEAQDGNVEEADMLHKMHSTIFSIENEIAATLDRPAYFPEPVSGLSQPDGPFNLPAQQRCPLTFDRDRPSDFLCSLYRLQHRFRKGDMSVRENLPPFDQTSTLHPGLRMALHQTHLLIHPQWGTAFYLLECIVSVDCIHMCLTPHWVYRAGCVLVENIHDIYEGDFIQLYSNALVVLELSSGRYPNTSVLRDSLVDLMQRMKKKHQPHWHLRGLQLADVRL